MHLPFDNIRYFTFFFVAYVKCGLYEISKSNSANAAHEPSLVRKMFRDQTEAMLDQSSPGPGVLF